MRTTVARTRSGFTLVELMVAVSLAVIIMTIVTIVFAQGTAVLTHAQSTVEATHSTRVALDFLEGDLRSAYLEGEGAIFLGVTDGDRGGVDNDRDGYDAGNDADDFDDTAGQERHGLEMLSMSMYAVDSSGNPLPGEHVLYYLTREGTTPQGRPMGNLIRCTTDVDSTEPMIGSDLSGCGSETVQEIAFGVVQLRFRYFSNGQWYDDGWDSTHTNGFDQASQGFQYRELPEVVEVRLTVVDMDGTLDKSGSNPVELSRLIPVCGAGD